MSRQSEVAGVDELKGRSIGSVERDPAGPSAVVSSSTPADVPMT